MYPGKHFDCVNYSYSSGTCMYSGKVCATCNNGEALYYDPSIGELCCEQEPKECCSPDEFAPSGESCAVVCGEDC